MKNKHLLAMSGLLFSGLFATSSFAKIDTTELTQIKAFHQHSADLISAGVPTTEEYSILNNAGVDTIINLIPLHSEIDRKNGIELVPELIRANNMAYYNVAFEFADPIATMEHFIGVMDRLKAQQQDVLVHCAANWRASIMVYFYNGIKTGKVNPLDLSPMGELAPKFKQYPQFKHFMNAVEQHYGLPLTH